MLQVFSAEWFKRHQPKLLWFVNTRVGRWFFRIHRIPHDVPITEITPDSLRWGEGVSADGRKTFRVSYRTYPRYAVRLRNGLKPLWYTLHFIDWVFNFSPTRYLRLNFGFDTFTQHPNPGRLREIDASLSALSFDELTFDQLRQLEGTSNSTTDAYIILASALAGNDTDKYINLTRSLIGFNVEGLHGFTLESGTLTLSPSDDSSYPAKSNGLGDLALSFVIANPFNPLNIGIGDFKSLSTSRICSDVPYSDWDESGDTVLTLNQEALDHIEERAGLSLYSRNVYFGGMLAVDLDGGSPTWSAYPAETEFIMIGSDVDSGTANDPELTIIYIGEKDLSESISFSDTATFTKITNHTDNLLISDTMSAIKVLNLSESIGVADTTGTFSFKLTLSESISVADTFSRAGTTFVRTLSETIDLEGDILGTPSELRKKTGISPVWILKIPFATETIYLSDRDFTCDSLDGGITTVGWVKDWSRISEDISGEMGKSLISDLSIQVLIDADATNTIHELLWDLSEDVESLTCELYVWVTELDGLGRPPELVWTGQISDYAQGDELNYSIQLTDKSVFLNKRIGNLVDTTEYPQLDPDDVGKMVPIVYGDVKHVPALAIDAGAISTIAEDLDSTETAVDISDASQFTSSGTVQVENEKISYTGKSGNTLTGCTRGVSGTTATTHDKGMQVGLVQSEYWYLLADHPVKSIDTVYVDGVRQTGGDFTTYTNHSGKAKVKFTTLPVLQKSVDVEVDDNMDVTDFAVSHNDTISSNAVVTENQVASQIYDITATIWDSGTNNIKAVARFTHPGISYDECEVTLRGYFTIWYGTFNKTLYIRLRSLVSPYYKSGWNAVAFRAVGENQIWYANVLLEHSSITSGDVAIEMYHDGANALRTLDVISCTRKVSADATVTGTGTATKADAIKDKVDDGKAYYVGLTGNSSADVVIGTQVTADIQGYEDDGSGTYTGTANALIERPDHVFKHFLDTYGDVDTADFYSNAGNFFASKSYAFAGILNQKKYIRTWLDEWAWQCRCYFKFSAGEAKLLWRPDSISSTKSITEAMVRREGANTKIKGPVPSPLRDIINVFDVQYNRDWTIVTGEDGSYKGILKEPATPATDPSVIRYGEKSKSELFRFDFVTSAAMAQDLLTFYRNTYKDRKKVFEVELFLDNFDLSFGQGVTLVPRDNTVCEIQTVNLYPGNGKSKRIDKVVLKLKEY